MVERKQIDFAYTFSEEVHAYRCSRARYRNQVGIATFPMRMVDPGDAPLAFVVAEGSVRTEVRLFSGSLFKMTGDGAADAYHAVCSRWEPCSWKPGAGFGNFRAEEPSKDMPDYPTLGSMDKAISDAREFAASRIVIDDALWKRAAEPSYRLNELGAPEIAWGFTGDCFNADERRAAERASADRARGYGQRGAGTTFRANSRVAIEVVMGGAVTYPRIEERFEWAAARMMSDAMERSFDMFHEARVQPPPWISEIQSGCDSVGAAIEEAVAGRRRSFLGGPTEKGDAVWARGVLEASCPSSDENKRGMQMVGAHFGLRY